MPTSLSLVLPPPLLPPSIKDSNEKKVYLTFMDVFLLSIGPPSSLSLSLSLFSPLRSFDINKYKHICLLNEYICISIFERLGLVCGLLLMLILWLLRLDRPPQWRLSRGLLCLSRRRRYHQRGMDCLYIQSSIKTLLIIFIIVFIRSLADAVWSSFALLTGRW